MSNFLSSVKADLVDRRLLPIVVLIVVAFVAAIGYAALGGGSSTPRRSASASRGLVTPAGVTVTPVKAEKAVAETTDGASQQHHGAVHNPFTPLPAPAEAKPKSAASNAGTSAASSTTAAGNSSPGSGSEANSSPSSSGASSPTTPATPATPSTPSKPSKSKTVYHVAVLFGELPAGVTPETAQLTPFENLKLLSPLPSAKQPLLVYRGVTVGGKSATFTLLSEAILHGPGACLPSTTQCEAIDLRSGQTEQLEYLSPTGQPLTYELRIVSIVSGKASSAALKSILRGESKAGRELLGHAGLVTIPDLHYSAQVGLLAFDARPRHRR